MSLWIRQEEFNESKSLLYILQSEHLKTGASWGGNVCQIFIYEKFETRLQLRVC